MRFFENFQQYFSGSRQLHIATNYRSSGKIVEVGNDLMNGLGTPAKPNRKSRGDVWLCDMASFRPTILEKQRYPGDLITPLVVRLAHQFIKDGKSVVMLSRRNGIPWFFNTGDKYGSGRDLNAFLYRVRSCLPKDMGDKLTISTAHKYKGLERQAVIVLDAVARSYPLIHPDWPFARIFGDSPVGITKDERRLFYVVLTRAIDSLVVVTDAAAQSQFIEEISARRSISPLRLKTFPAVADEANRRLLLRIKDSADRRYGANDGTYNVKDSLRASRYHFDGVAKVWERDIELGAFNLEEIQAESWAQAASGVEMKVYDEAETLMACYGIDNGRWVIEFERWNATSRV